MNAVSSLLPLHYDIVSPIPLTDSPPLNPMDLTQGDIESFPSFYSPPLEKKKFTLEEHFYFENIKASSYNDRPLSVVEASSSVVERASSTPPDSPLLYLMKYHPSFFVCFRLTDVFCTLEGIFYDFIYFEYNLIFLM